MSNTEQNSQPTPDPKLYEPPEMAMRSAAPIVDAVWESNGNPTSIHIDKFQMQRLIALAIDTAVKAVRGSW